jgi:NhaA family Na+:H+ antiporter
MARRSRATDVLAFIFDNSLLLLIGAGAALVWANTAPSSYEQVAHAAHGLVNDVGMVFFFALAAKEVYEAMLPGGPLASVRQAGTPVLAAIGGMAAPAGLYIGSVLLLNEPDLTRGWAIPCATDIAFSYLVSRVIFPSGHPAVPFLLLLAIADDAMGLIVLAVFYPTAAVSPGALVLWMAPALGAAWLLRRYGVRSFWIYLAIPGLMSWLGLHFGGLHPALALVPIVPFMPHHKSDLKVFATRPVVPVNTLHEFEDWWRMPVQLILLAFGLVNAGVPLSSIGPVSWAITGSLIVGKPLGIVAFTLMSQALGFRRPAELDWRSLVVLGITAGIGFTVALFFSTAAFPPGPIQDQAKMGALISFFAGPLAVAAGWILRVAPGSRRSA